ncbi:MAG: DUF1028 domain-containing protein [Candidatus Zixiibacteriota bacterium]|nr:MAG: DUF1028 domain-containing protein [candidate division Zixibacteria bacterium]
MGRMYNKLPLALALFSVLLLLLIPSKAGATFSIVAVDTATGAVGSAGASCIAGSQVIHDCIEGIGAINTQAYYIQQNQNNAHSLMVSGLAPDSIIGWLINNDVENDPEFRQYGVVTLAGPGASAAYTGAATTFWRGHLTGFGYAIQGNILLDESIVDTMEYAYLNTEGPLEEKLMAALEAANVPGADIRCMSCSKPAISAYIKVIHLGDGSTPYLYEFVDNTTCPVNPVDSVRLKFDWWKEAKLADPDSSIVEVSPAVVPATGSDSALVTVTPLNFRGESPTQGAGVSLSNTGEGILRPVVDNGDGTFSAWILSPAIPGPDTIVASITANEQTVEAAAKPGLKYYRCGDANDDGGINLLDVLYLIDHLYGDPIGPAPVPPEAGDANADGDINLLDILYLIDNLYGTPPGPEPECP